MKRAGYKTDGKKDPYFTARAYCENKDLKIGGRRRQRKRCFKSECALISSIFIWNGLRATCMIASSTYELVLKRPGCVNLHAEVPKDPFWDRPYLMCTSTICLAFQITAPETKPATKVSPLSSPTITPRIDKLKKTRI